MAFLSKIPCVPKFLFVFELSIGALVIGLLQLIFNVIGLLYLFISLGIASLSGIVTLIFYIISIALALLLLYGTFKKNTGYLAIYLYIKLVWLIYAVVVGILSLNILVWVQLVIEIYFWVCVNSFYVEIGGV